MDSVWIVGNFYPLEDYIFTPAKIKKLDTLERDVISFMVDWFSGKETFNLKTSGSTGRPTVITIQRDQMIASAEMTLNYLNVTKGRKALLCLHPSYIAGLMMIVRSIIGELDLYVISPSSNPLKRNDLIFDFDIASFVPYQVAEILSNTLSRDNFRKIRNVLIGGADISENLIRKMRAYENNIYQTFGMTETVSHIALKRISGIVESDSYEVLEGIEISKDDRGCLIVKGRITGNEKITTNDLVDLIDDKRFMWKGRIDQVINTGGIIINIDDLESRIRNVFSVNNINNIFFIAGIEDVKLGEKVILVFETRNKVIEEERILGLLRQHLSRYEIPKKIYTMENFFLLDTGKIDRKANLEKLDI